VLGAAGRPAGDTLKNREFSGKFRKLCREVSKNTRKNTLGGEIENLVRGRPYKKSRKTQKNHDFSQKSRKSGRGDTLGGEPLRQIFPIFRKISEKFMILHNFTRFLQKIVDFLFL
jgi:hypothetical protein